MLHWGAARRGSELAKKDYESRTEALIQPLIDENHFELVEMCIRDRYFAERQSGRCEFTSYSGAGWRTYPVFDCGSSAGPVAYTHL